MDFRVFLSVLMVYQHNFRILHWKASGIEFHTQHDWAAKYYDELGEYIDKIAEISIRLKQDPVNYKEAVELLENYNDHDFELLEAGKKYDIKSFVENCDIMFGDILKCIEELLQSDIMEDIKNVGIKSDLEAMYASIDLQYRYINEQRKG